MSNRKYAAALLEGNSAKEKERLESAINITKEKIKVVTEQIMNDPMSNPEEIIRNYAKSKSTQQGIQSVAQKMFEDIAPDLAKEYDMVVGILDNHTTLKWDVIVGYKPKPPKNREERRHWSDIQARAIDTARIRAGSINADHVIEPIQFRERYGVGIINNNGIARVRTNE